MNDLKHELRRMGAVALAVLVLDQVTKALVLRWLHYAHERVVLEGFFKFVHWGNTGAAWSFLKGHNSLLAIVSLAALGALFYARRHFDSGTPGGKLALGLLFGGIVGNLLDRIFRGHVIDFIYFYVQARGGGEVGFPAFNVADSAICIGVGLLFLFSLQSDSRKSAETSAARVS